MSDAVPSPVQRLGELIEGFWTTQVINAAVQLKLPDLLAADSLSPQEIAQRSGGHAGSVIRLLRALATLGVCTCGADGRFALTEMGGLLRTETPGGKSARALFAGSSLYRAFEKLGETVRTGHRPPVTADFGKSSPEQLAIFQNAMIESSREAVASAVLAYDFGPITRVLDVGGGFGGALAALLTRFPGLSGEVLDLAHAQQGAEAYLARSGVGGRARFLPGDFFAQVPSGYDCYLLKFILHDWDDEQAIAVLRSCRAVAAPEARLIVLERLVPERPEDRAAHRTVMQADMTMMAWGGQERTEPEYQALFAAAGWRLSRVVGTASPFSVIEGRPD